MNEKCSAIGKIILVFFVSAVVGLEGQVPAPRISETGVINVASGQAGSLSAGEIITILDPDFRGAVQRPYLIEDGNYVTNSPDGVRVLFDGLAARILYASPGQTTVVVPDTVLPGGSVRLRMEHKGVAPDELVLPVVPSAPGIFTLDPSGQGQAAVLNSDATVNGPSRPAAIGTAITIFATGAGILGRRPTARIMPAPAGPQVFLPLSVRIGGVDAEILDSGHAQGLPDGVFQITVRVPGGIASDSRVALSLTVGGGVSQSDVTLSITDEVQSDLGHTSDLVTAPFPAGPGSRTSVSSKIEAHPLATAGPLTIGQGGTGAAGADIARANLGAAGIMNSNVFAPGTVQTLLGTLDASAASATRPARIGFGAPSTGCAVGEQYFRTDATAGQNIYLCSAASVWTQTLSFTHASAGAITRPMAQRLQETISVKDFGACGNNICDDTSAIQAAIDATASNLFGRSVYLPPGTYKTSGPLFTRFGRFRIISDHAQINYAPTGLAGAALVVDSSGNMIEIDGIDFSGPGNPSAMAVQVTGGPMTLTITHCVFYGWGRAIRVDTGDTQSLSITHNIFWGISGTAIDIYTSTDDLEIAHNNFQSNVATAIAVDNCIGASAVLIHHNDFLTTGSAVVIKNVTFVTIQNNEFEQDAVTNVSSHSALIDLVGGPSNSARVRVLNNTLNANSRAQFGVYVGDSVYNSTFSDNNVTNYSVAGFQVGLGTGNVYLNNFGPTAATLYNTVPTNSVTISYSGTATTISGRLSAAPGGTVPALVGLPASKTSTCIQGSISWNASYLYLCVSTNSWVRFPKDAGW